MQDVARLRSRVASTTTPAGGRSARARTRQHQARRPGGGDLAPRPARRL